MTLTADCCPDIKRRASKYKISYLTSDIMLDSPVRMTVVFLLLIKQALVSKRDINSLDERISS